MRKLIVKTVGLAFLFAVSGNIDAHAQGKRQIRAQYRSTPPTAVFVELFTYQNKIDRYKRTKQGANAEAMQKDAAIIIAKTVADFNANFNFCPVYYFYDTNADLVLNRKFERALLDRNLNPVSTSPASDADTNYLILNYGPAAISSKSYETIGAGEKNNSLDGVGDNVLINSFKGNILNYAFEPLPSFVLYDKKFFFRANTTTYAYTSKKFNISYKDMGAYLSKKLNDFYHP